MKYYLATTVLSWAHTLSNTDIVVLIAVLILHRIVALAGIWIYAIFTLAGTLAHELCHYIAALFLGARPTFPSLIPTRIEGGWRLGSVNFCPNLWKNIPIALAPFALAPIGLWWAASFMHVAKTGVEYFGHAWIAGTMMMASLPSRQDWKIAAPAIVVVVIGAGLAWRYGLAW